MEPNVFVCTVHIASEPLWSVIQPSFLRAHLPNAVLIAAIDQRLGAAPAFDDVSVMEGTHRGKLDELGRRVADGMTTAESDVIVFIDGDAFPVRPLMPLIADVLRDFPLAAVCREENDEDYPHPSFCVTTVGFWRHLGGTWEVSSDPASRFNELGGGKLRDLMRDRGVTWRRLLRSNAFNPHPVMFGLYERVIYHHGAGFRTPVTAADRKQLAERVPAELSALPDSRRRLNELIGDRNEALSMTFKRLIRHTPDFYRILEGP